MKDPPIFFAFPVFFFFFFWRHIAPYGSSQDLSDFVYNAPKDASENSRANGIKFRVPSTSVFSVNRGFLPNLCMVAYVTKAGLGPEPELALLCLCRSFFRWSRLVLRRHAYLHCLYYPFFRWRSWYCCLFVFFRATYSPLWQLPRSLKDFVCNAPKDASENYKTIAVKYRVPSTCVFSVALLCRSFFRWSSLVLRRHAYLHCLYYLFFRWRSEYCCADRLASPSVTRPARSEPRSTQTRCFKVLFFQVTYSPLWQLPRSLKDFVYSAPQDASENYKTNAVKYSGYIQRVVFQLITVFS